MNILAFFFFLCLVTNAHYKRLQILNLQHANEDRQCVIRLTVDDEKSTIGFGTGE